MKDNVLVFEDELFNQPMTNITIDNVYLCGNYKLDSYYNEERCTFVVRLIDNDYAENKKFIEFEFKSQTDGINFINTIESKNPVENEIYENVERGRLFGGKFDFAKIINSKRKYVDVENPIQTTIKSGRVAFYVTKILLQKLKTRFINQFG